MYAKNISVSHMHETLFETLIKLPLTCIMPTLEM